MLKKSIFFFNFLFTSLVLSGQNANYIIDSLQTLIEDLNKQSPTFINDTSRIRNLNLISSKLITAGDLEKGDSLANEALLIGKTGLLMSEGLESLGYKKGIGKSYRNRGNAAFYKENYKGALEFYFHEVDVWESLLEEKDLSEIFKKNISMDLAKVLGNIGNVYTRQDNYPKALSHNYRSLKIHESLNNEKQVGIAYGNIGIVYYRMRDYSKALECYKKALQISQKLNITTDQSRHLANIGIVYSEQKKYPEALKCFASALKLAEEGNYINAVTSILDAMGSTYARMNEYNKALELMNKALTLAEKNEDKGLISQLNGNIGGVLLTQNKFNEAETFLLKAFSLAKEIGELRQQEEWSLALSRLYRKQNKSELAFNYYEKYDQIKDSIFNKENSMNTVRQEMDYEYQKKEAKEKAEYEKQIIMFEAERKINQQMLFFLIIGIALVLLLLFFVQRAYQAKRKYSEVLAADSERKELLLQEVHHRINNNLQIISSLLTLQANSVEDEKLNEYLIQSQNRIQSLSVLHELLYQNDTQLQININEYINKVLDFHKSLAKGHVSDIVIEAEVYPVAFSAKLAVPVALIINELVTNSLKYAFDGQGKIIVMLLPANKVNNEWRLVVSDNGKGMPPEEGRRKNSLGLRLVNMMIKQIKGEMIVRNAKGTTVEIIFKALEE